MPNYLPNSKNTDANGVLAPEVSRLTQHDSQARDFLDFLVPGESVTFQTFDDRPGKRPELARVFHGTLKQHADMLAHLNKLGAGVFVMVNAGNGTGRAKENVTRVRAVFADFDGVALPERWELKPHLLVMSSPGKYHAFWLVSDLPLDEFSRVQKALASHFCSDEAVSDLPRVMRVPGFYHCKGESVMVELLETGAHPAYTRAELLAAWPSIDDALKPKPESKPKSSYAMPKSTADADQARRYGLTALQREHDVVASAKEGARNHSLNTAAFSLGQLIAAGALERHEVEDALGGAAKACGLPEREGLRTIRSGLEAGMKEPREIPESRADTQQDAKVQEATAPSTPWPAPLETAAFYGLAGQIVHLIAPHTEADEAALLFQLLAAFGNAVGRSAYYLVESDRHYANINVAVVGNSAKGRKGTSQSRVKAVMMHADPAWSERIVSGLSSGEGLIWAVRDAIIKVKKTGEEEVVDEGVADKRLMVLESELSSALKVMSREGNTLSATVRNAWDTGNLRTLTKNSPARATDAHISLIGHITKDELLRHLDATEMANGFANRFLWICVRRSKLLPFGGDLNENNIANIGVILADRLARAKSISRVTMDAEARADWALAYADLSEAKPGLFGSIIARSEAQVLRLALIYALFDASSVIKRVHLEAALACWEYSEASARYLFGDSLGNPMADTILQALKESKDGLSRTKIRDIFDRNAKAEAIEKALKALAEANLAYKTTVKTVGRPLETWYAR